MKKSAAKDEGFQGFVLEQLARLGGDVTARRMMGGWTLYRDGVVFALIARGALYLKADAENRPMFEARGLPAFVPDETQPEKTMSYFLVPADVLEDREELARWSESALTASGRGTGKGRRA